jgi:cell division protein FtsI/penicillin-binding protein 2
MAERNAPPLQDETLSRRLTFLGMVMIALSGILIARLLSFQFRMDPKVKEQLELSAENRQSQTVELLPSRGEIYDRNGYLLAVNTFEYRIGISPTSLLDREEVARELAPLLNVSEDEIYRDLSPDSDGDYPAYVMLAPLVNYETGQAILELDIDGMQVETTPSRIYPQGALTGQIVGFFAGAEDNRHGRGYWGVEGYYQTWLAGQARRIRESNIPNEENNTNNVQNGIDIELTIDRDLQNLAQEVLDQAVIDYAATGGTIIIMNPRTGEILAMVNNPNFDPNNTTSAENMERARNQAISEVYEPGSVFKVLTMAMALEAGTHDLNWTYYDPGCADMYGIPICNWDRTSHGNPTFSEVFIRSWNTGTATIFDQMQQQLGGPQHVYDMMENFGIGSKTGVDLEGEEDGLLVEPSSPDWSAGQYLNNSFGQGVAVTSLQMLTAVNAIANDGLIMQPHIVRARIENGQRIEIQPSASYRPISAETAHTARDIMIQVVTDPNRDDLFEFPGYSIAGKTGTAEVAGPDGRYLDNVSIASFVGFLPADDPVVSVIVKLDGPDEYWGAYTAAPTFQTLVERLVVLMEIPPDDMRHQLESLGGEPLRREY